MQQFFNNKSILNQTLNWRLAKNKSVDVVIKREDLLHPEVSGNKFRKLKYNLIKAKADNFKTLLTFGGAFSNHIAATAAAGHMFDFKTIGVIRGDELGMNLQQTLMHNPTLQLAHKYDMAFKFVSRSDYRLKHTSDFLKSLHNEFGVFYEVPEGGTNKLAVMGCEEILKPQDKVFDYICVAVGTGGTISGLINTSKPHQKVLGFPALKGDFLAREINGFIKQKSNFELITDYHFGGYAKVSKDLIIFINKFKAETAVALDAVYTGKMLFGLADLIENNYFKKGSKILLIHTGGLQGNTGMNKLVR
ncbi:MAG: pyridoxal-phosphate dependent enzyme, partial [Flavobacteriaceae bacterium]|nr:pyridoxal-phosphate dependent enzyme [Flavobacteriaceae bacterium]